MLSKTDVIERLTRAFVPLKCVAELQDYESKVGFCVFDTMGEPRYTRSRVPLRLARDERGLAVLIRHANTAFASVVDTTGSGNLQPPDNSLAD